MAPVATAVAAASIIARAVACTAAIRDRVGRWRLCPPAAHFCDVCININAAARNSTTATAAATEPIACPRAAVSRICARRCAGIAAAAGAAIAVAYVAGGATAH